ncbi:MAG: DUF4349 domain-containing protein [Leptolyngbya sp. SIOISBB]|nr:DUF4349 domain-containing protein [Leptolyngbya sp. SIOISBB]
MRLGSSAVKSHTAGLVGVLSMVALVGCSGAPAGISSHEETASQDLEIATTVESASAEPAAADRGSQIPSSSFQRTTRLIKHATLDLEMADVDAAITSVSDVLEQYQGDLLQLSDLGRQETEIRQINLQLRVPQANLESTLAAFRELGDVTNQSIAAEDVSNQLVDLQARVRNLRKSEESLLEIMERSGSIADVLEVSRELSVVRESIERNDAQLKNLQNRVAYSTITLTLVSTQPIEPPASPIGETLSQTWQAASSSMQSLSVGLLQLLLWLLAFSPYIGILVLSAWVGQRYWQRQRSPETPANSN